MSPIKKLSLICILLCTLNIVPKLKKQYILLLDSAGDSQHQGRNIQQHYERTLTFTMAQALKKELEKNESEWLVLFTRLPGESMNQIERVSFANQLPADLYISLHMYPSNYLKTELYIYYHSSEQVPLNIKPSNFIPLQKAHIIHQHQTKQLAHHLKNYVSDISLQRHYTVHEPMGLPCLVCKGIIAPSLCLEIGLHNADDWTCLIEPLAQAVQKLCLHLKDT